MSDKIRVLFVCHGNICRSPLAEGVFRRLVQDAGVAERFEIDSAGISGYHAGEAPDPRTTAEARRRGIILEHSARRMMPRDLAKYDHILVMDRENLSGVRRLAEAGGDDGVVRRDDNVVRRDENVVRRDENAMRREDGAMRKVRLLRSCDPASAGGDEVPDPYYGGPGGFSDVQDMVECACRGLLLELTSASAPAGG